MTLHLSIETTSGAAADGVDTNSATITLSNNDVFLNRAKIDFRVTGSAKFADSGSNTTVALTNLFGKATVQLTDTVSETVTVTAVYTNQENTVSNGGPSTFGNGGSSGLVPPILEEAEGNVVDLTKVDTTVHVRIPAWKNMAVGDVVTLYWNHIAPWQTTYILTAADIDRDIIFDVDADEHLKPYLDNTLYIYYSVNNKISETAEYLVVDSGLSNLTIIGERGNLNSAQSLLAFNRLTQTPANVRWQYKGETTIYTGTRFTDRHPLKELQVSLGASTHYIKVYPLNVSSSGRNTEEDSRSRAFIVNAEGKLSSWGSYIDWATPPSTITALTNIKGLLGSPYAAVVLTEENRLYGWGLKDNGALEVPLNNIVSAGFSRTAFAALDNNGKLHTWGNGVAGGSLPNEIAQQTGFNYVVGARAAFCALNDNGKIVSWGEANYGGNMPSYIKDLNNIAYVCASDGAFAALTRDGSVHAWGHSDFGGALTMNLSNIVAITSTSGAFTALAKNGKVYAWGQISEGGSPPNSIQQLDNVVAVSASDAAFAVLCSDGALYAWGNGFYGGHVPVQIQSLDGIIALSSSLGGFSVITKNNTVAMWTYYSHQISASSTIEVKANYRINRAASPNTYLTLSANKSVKTFGENSDVSNISDLPESVTRNINHSDII